MKKNAKGTHRWFQFHLCTGIVRMSANRNSHWLVLLAVALMLLPMYPMQAGDDACHSTFLQALDSFDRAQSPAEFQHAALLFESLLGDGYENGAVLYNLGNARMRAGQVGLAIAAYRRAKRLLPRVASVEANLQAAMNAAPDAMRLESAPWWQRVFFWHGMLAQNERLQASAAAWILAFLLGLVRLFRADGARSRKAISWCCVAILAVGTLLSVSAALGHEAEVRTKHGVVVAPDTLARKGNGAGYDPAFDRPLKEGAEFVALESRGDWIHARFAGAGEGWLPEKDASIY